MTEIRRPRVEGVMLGRALVVAVSALALPACAGYSARAAAPDEQGGVRLARPEDPPGDRSGAVSVVHVDSAIDATLVRLDEHHRVVDQCRAPCDAGLPVEGTYRVDGAAIRSSWPFRLQGVAGQRVTVTVVPETRASYATARTVTTVGGVLMALGLGTQLFGGVAGTALHDAHGGAPASCTSCDVAFVGGGLLGLVGAGITITGIVMGVSAMSSGTSQRVE